MKAQSIIRGDLFNLRLCKLSAWPLIHK